MKKYLGLVLASLCLIGCQRTSIPEDPAGKIDMSKPVDYVLISQDQRDQALYILTGKLPEEEEEGQEPSVENLEESQGEEEGSGQGEEEAGQVQDQSTEESGEDQGQE